MVMTLQSSDTPLVAKLTEKQRAAGQSDAEFAGRLGISRVWWNQIKNGRQPIRTEVLSATVREFPDLHPDVISFLACLPSGA